MRSFDDPLRILDDIAWRRDPEYSNEVKDFLEEADRLIESSQPGDHTAALALLNRLRPARMAKQQRIRLLHALGKVSMELSVNAEAVSAFDEVLDLVLPDASASPLHTDEEIEAAIMSIEFAQLDARVRHWQGKYRLASELLEIVIDLIRELPTDRRTPRIRSLELRLFKSLADYYYMLERCDDAQAYLDKADALRALSADPARERAGVLWTQSLLHRWHGKFAEALWTAQEAAEIFARFDERALARVDIHIVECALDAAAYFLYEGVYLAYFAHYKVAATYLQATLELAEKSDDVVKELALLAQARLDRLTSLTIFLSEHQARCVRIAEVFADAQQMDDVALEIAALTELGREYEAYGDIAIARKCYEAARTTLAQSDMPVMGVWARRGITRLKDR